MVRLSVIILTCNQRPVTERLLDTLLPYVNGRDDVEVIVVDNGSADGTAEALRGRKDIPAGDRLRIIETHANLGVACGRNIGLREARGKYLMLLDNDTEVTAEAMDGLLRYMNEHPQCGLCAPALYGPDGELQDSAKPFPGIALKARHLLGRKEPDESEREAMRSRHPFYVIGACQLFRREVMESTGLLDENIFYGPEDADFCIRIRSTGHTVDYIPELKICHHWRRATRHRPWSRLSWLHFRALLHFYLKYRRCWR